PKVSPCTTGILARGCFFILAFQASCPWLFFAPGFHTPACGILFQKNGIIIKKTQFLSSGGSFSEIERSLISLQP
ncbi:MAG: hypothetical protein LBQ97_06405, partial [Fusobacteriaceae bacterium]|nr:hypothetical protein [Fusobacteriaceae bacterium]